MKPPDVTFRPANALSFMKGPDWPMATKTCSYDSSKDSLSGTMIGHGIPLASAVPGSVGLQVRCSSLPAFPLNATTCVRSLKRIPSSFAPFISSGSAGIRPSGNQDRMVTPAPRRLRVRARSKAALPSPMTAISPFIFRAWP